MLLPSLCGWHEIRIVRHVSCLLERWSEHKTVGRAMCCFIKDKLRFAGLRGFVPCLQPLGGMAQLSLERVEEIPVQDSSYLGERARQRGECVKGTETELMVWDCVGGAGDPAWQLCKAPAEAKALPFPRFASKIITCLRNMGLFGTDLILVLDIYLWI